MRTVEGAALESAAEDNRVAARSEEGIAVSVAAAPAAPRNLRREMNGIFMGTGKYSGKGLKRDGGFHSLKTSSLPRETAVWLLRRSHPSPTSRKFGEKWGT